MHTILCYGDSNTFGSNPSAGRWGYLERWTGCLSSLLGPSFRVLEEGLGGRTTVFDDPLEPNRNGKDYLPVVLQSHRPIDLVILSLGTNDCKSIFCANERFIAKALEQLATMVKHHPYGPEYPVPQVLVISPIFIGEKIEHTAFASYDASSVALSRRLAPEIEAMAKRNNLLFVDAATVAKSSELDQLHMDSKSHQALAQALEPVIRSYFGEEAKPVIKEEEVQKPTGRTLRFPFLRGK
ncbi:MAG: G-D-S-L family lipolytic protein [Spirochaetia bacterium]|nr:G-D-S-L family lipolytic protein [Spirochaetia bacterium]